MAQLGSGEYTYEVSGDNWGELPDGWIYREATAVAVDSSDNVYVFNRGGHPVIVFDSEGKFLSSWGEDIFATPHGITIGPDDSIFCVDTGDCTVRKLTTDGKVLFTLGDPGNPAPPMSGKPFGRPTHVGIDPRNGNFYVADGYANAHVHKYDPEGNYLGTWGESGTDVGQLNIVHNIDIDSDGYVYIGDRENHRVQIFDQNGKYETQWVNMSRAAAVYIDRRGDSDTVYVGEYFAGIASNMIGTDLGPRVSIYQTDGTLLARVGRKSYGDEPGRFYSPHGIAVDSRGDIYVAEVAYSDYGMHMEPPRELRSMQKLVKTAV
jgi:DNA-binding beta-propeller fold protein YncE